ncbi:MAG: hypothetical protein KDM63_14855 [Verrucomicrobiae bacterium]|nr:hypothetical protein [Verrucomicrobiae bacterium]
MEHSHIRGYQAWDIRSEIEVGGAYVPITTTQLLVPFAETTSYDFVPLLAGNTDSVVPSLVVHVNE